MRPAALLPVIIVSALLSAQHEPRSPIVRSIRVKAVSTSLEGLTPIEFKAITAAWKRSRVNLAVENPLHLDAIETAGELIREMYGREGHAVRVEHGVTQIPHRGVEVAFEVIELCNCK